MDGLLGISYLAGLVVPSVRPLNLFDEAFSGLHARMGLPSISASIHNVPSMTRDDKDEANGHSERSHKSKSSEHGGHPDDDDELNALLSEISENGDENDDIQKV
jgi:hypothetical protein